MNSKRICELLGIAYVAKKIAWGEVSCIEKIKNKSATLIILANDIGQATKKKIEHFALANDLPVVNFSTKLELGHCIGKEVVSVIAITDKILASKLKKLSEV